MILAVRVVTINMWGDRAPLDARLDLAAACLAALRPDAVLMQEVRRGDGLACTATALAARLAACTSAPWAAEYRAATIGPAGTWGAGSGAGEEGLAILAPRPLADVSALELPDARPTERRILLSARLDGVTLSTTHLHWRRSDGDARRRQAEAIVAALAARPGPHVLGGDFNATPDLPDLAPLGAAFVDAFAAAHPGEPGLTWTARNPYTAPLHKVAPPDRRIDLVFVSAAVKVREACVVLDAPDANGVWPSDHFGLLVHVGFSAAA